GGADTASRWASLSPSSRWETSIRAFYGRPVACPATSGRRALAKLAKHRVEGGGPRQQETLELVAAARAQPLVLVPGFHALGDDGELQALGHAQDRVADRLGVGVAAQVADEGLVELEPFHRKVLEIGQA